MSKCQEIALRFLIGMVEARRDICAARSLPGSIVLTAANRTSSRPDDRQLSGLALANSRSATAKGLYLDLDPDGDRRLATLRGVGCFAPARRGDPHFDGETSSHLSRQGIHDSRAGSDVERTRRDIRRRPCMHRLCKGIPVA